MNIKKLYQSVLRCQWVGMGLLLALPLSPLKAETITIGKGSGVVWEGLPFSGTLSGSFLYSALYPISFMSLAAITVDPLRCRNRLTEVNGTSAIKLTEGVWLVPRLNITGDFVRYNGKRETFSGSIGLPTTDLRIGSTGNQMGRDGWCFSPEGIETNIEKYYSPSEPRTMNYNGSWVLITDGTQKRADNIKLPPYYIASLSVYHAGSLSERILPTAITLRVSTLECSVNTPVDINFGPVTHNPQKGAEMGQISSPVTVLCIQDTDLIDANINLQFRAISGLYENSPQRLALQEKADGGYITGEIAGVTGSGSCTGNSGIAFNSTPYKIGAITSAQKSSAMANYLIWRLCSGGSSLPMGDVHAAAEMLVTFN